MIYEVLALIDKDSSISKTVERISKSENDIILFLNEFYRFVFKKIEDNEKIDYKLIPNEKGMYKKLEDIYKNKNKEIDEDIRHILSTLDKQKSYDNILIHHGIELSRHSEKTLEDISKEIDEIIKIKYQLIDNCIENSQNKENESENNDIKNDTHIKSQNINTIIGDNIIEACKELLQKWFKNNMDKRKYFRFINTHIIEISFKILKEQFSKVQKDMENMLINQPDNIVIKNNQKNNPNNSNNIKKEFSLTINQITKDINMPSNNNNNPNNSNNIIKNEISFTILEEFSKLQKNLENKKKKKKNQTYNIVIKFYK